MKLWPTIRLGVVHCCLALALSAMFAGTLYALTFFYPPDSPIIWWFKAVDMALAIYTAVALGVAFICSFSSIVLNAIIRAWKGFPNGDKNFVLV